MEILPPICSLEIGNIENQILFPMIPITPIFERCCIFWSHFANPPLLKKVGPGYAMMLRVLYNKEQLMNHLNLDL